MVYIYILYVYMYIYNVVDVDVVPLMKTTGVVDNSVDSIYSIGLMSL